MALNTETDLQLRYTQLLEKRIAQLEELLNEAPKASGSPKADGVTESKEAGVDELTKDKATETDSKKEKTVKPITQYRNILRKWDRIAGVYKDEDVNAALKSETKDVAYTFRRVYNPETGEKGAYSELDIEGEELIAILKSVINNKYPGINFNGELVSMTAPFSLIIHSWNKLTQKLEDKPESQATQDLRHLLDSVQSAPELEKYFKTREANINAQITTYETLWTCFAPKTRIIAKPFMKTP